MPSSHRRGLEMHHLHTSLSKMAYDLHAQVKAVEKRHGHYKLRESECQIQVEISGLAMPVTEWQDVDVQFPESFYIGDGQRDSPNQDPHLSTGYTIEEGPPIVVSAHVKQWFTSDDDEYYGAKVSIGSHDLTASGAMFRGIVHLTFQGLGAPVDSEEGDYDSQGTSLG